MRNDVFSKIVRRMWIDSVLEEEGCINRAEIARAFRISVQQASHDLRDYMAAHPGRIYYDYRLKSYFTFDGTQPLFTRWHRHAAYEIVRAVEVLAP